MITQLTVNGLRFEIEYDLDVQAIYFGDLESEFIDIEIHNVIWKTDVTDIDGSIMEFSVDILPVIQSMEQEEALKLILRDRMEDRE